MHVGLFMCKPFPSHAIVRLTNTQGNTLMKNIRIQAKYEMPILLCIEIIVGNGAFARYEQMLHFLHCFQIVSATEALKGACVEERANFIYFLKRI